MTKSEQAIQELWKSVSKLEERVENARSDLKDAELGLKITDDRHLKVNELLNEINRRVSVIEENVKELKRLSEEKDRRQWAIVLAAFGSFLTLAVNIALIYFKMSR